MTTLGKILVFVNLMLSLLIMALIVSTYIGRTNWHQAYLDLEADRKLSQQNTQAFQDAKAASDQKVDQLMQQIQADNLAHNKALAAARDEEARAKAQTDLKVQEAERLRLNLTTSQQELQASQSEKGYLRTRLSEMDGLLQKANLDRQEHQNARVAAEIAQRQTQQRNEMLLTENERLHKDLKTVKDAGLNAAVAGNGPKRRPPAEDVEGVVKATDSQSGYISITIGSDAGLKKGDTLEVYRLKPEAAYLGVVEILEVRSNEAVAKPISRVRGVIQVGDRVSSNVVTKR